MHERQSFIPYIVARWFVPDDIQEKSEFGKELMSLKMNRKIEKRLYWGHARKVKEGGRPNQVIII
jgi:hypothetical protein